MILLPGVISSNKARFFTAGVLALHVRSRVVADSIRRPMCTPANVVCIVGPGCYVCLACGSYLSGISLEKGCSRAAIVATSLSTPFCTYHALRIGVYEITTRLRREVPRFCRMPRHPDPQVICSICVHARSWRRLCWAERSCKTRAALTSLLCLSARSCRLSFGECEWWPWMHR